MPQEFHVLQCYSCSTFQVHQVKKSSNKWSCKLCGEKQSIKKVFGRGSGADCRCHVQRLNTLRQEQDITNACTAVCDASHSAVRDDELGSGYTEHEEMIIRPYDNSGSKWSQYVEEVAEDSINEILQPGEEQYTTDGNQFYGCRKRKRENGNSYNRKGMRSRYDSDDSSEISWKTHTKNLQYSDENYNRPQPSQPSYPVTQLNKPWQNSTQEKCVAEITPIQNNVATFKKRDHMLDTVDQNRIPSANVTNFENIAEPRPKTTKLVFSNQEGKSNGSKWDQFIEKEDREPENSDEECPEIPPQDVEFVSLQNKLCRGEIPEGVAPQDVEFGSLQNKLCRGEIPEGVPPQDVEFGSLQNKLCRGERSGNKDGESGSLKIGDSALFSVGDLEDSDFDI
ncbi:MRN complex-interacting protein-like isoform X2 [Ostrea edulis]|uniref:MRN complex-interacting protein-like isoform X2 n=1 Tax=Ostrea edulis TaxID=37623 RepID=UPI0024AF2482|nr:MRN complex-interacting protein-like isoform X2 [Ostrea edulis]